jgi:dipeptidyl aminopeptidase/acylaminoacyl peptidase
MRRFWLGLACALMAAPAVAAPLEAYGKLPSIEAAAVSPNGSALGYITANGEDRTVAVQDLATGKVLMIATAGGQKVREILWAGDRHLLVITTLTTTPVGVIARRGEYAVALDFDLKKGKIRKLLDDAPGDLNTIVGAPIVRTVDGETVLFLEGIHFVDGRGCVSLFRINLDTGSSKLAFPGTRDTRDWIIDANGEPLAQEAFHDDNGRWALKIRRNSGWRETGVTTALLDAPDVLGLSRDGASVLVATDTDGAAAWTEVNGAGQWGKAAVLDGPRRPIHEPQTGRLIGYYVLVGDEDRYVFFDPLDQKAWAAIRRALPSDRISLVSWSSDHKKVVVAADSPTEGPAYAIVDLATGKLSWLGQLYAGVKADDVAPVKPVRFKAADGLELSGYLTLPRGRRPSGLPLIVFAHGGPAARDTPGFDWWAQAMVSRGYAVLQVNFRGSDGFGWDFTKAGFGEWGRKMQSDLSDGVRWLAAQGTIDPKRVCIVGGSYGGYAALAGVTLEKGVYRCAVSFGGVADLRRMVGYSKDQSGKAAMRYWTRFMGATDMNDPVLARYSPALQAANAESPILLIHGKDDTVVPLSQSQQMADALQKAGKPVELVVQNHADHWLSLGQTRLEMLQATMAFVEKYNPPQ